MDSNTIEATNTEPSPIEVSTNKPDEASNKPDEASNKPDESTNTDEPVFSNGSAFSNEVTEKANAILTNIANAELDYLENHEVNMDPSKLDAELGSYQRMTIRYSKGKLSDSDMMPVMVGMEITIRILPKEFDASILTKEEIRREHLVQSVQLLEFIKSCRILMGLSISKEEYDALPDSEKATFVEITGIDSLVLGINKIAPYIQKRLNVNLLSTLVNRMRQSIQDIDDADEEDKIDYCPNVSYKEVNPDIGLNSVIRKLNCGDDVEDPDVPFIHLEIADADNNLTYLLNVKITKRIPHLTILEWGVDTGGTVKTYNVYGNTTYELHQGGAWLYQDIGSAFDNSQVLDRVTTENIGYISHNSKFVQTYDISHKFMLVGNEQIESRHGEKGINTDLSTCIRFAGAKLSEVNVDKEQVLEMITV